MRPKNLQKEDAIRSVALRIIAEEGLEHLSMQKLAKAANVSPRTIYIKYQDKEDLLLTLFIKDVLAPYEQAVLHEFDAGMDFTEGIRKIWFNTFHYLRDHPHSFALLRYGRSSPQLHKAYQKENIVQGHFFAPIHQFLSRHVALGIIADLPFDVHRALLLAPLLELVSEYFDYTHRPVQIITEQVLSQCCDSIIRSLLK